MIRVGLGEHKVIQLGERIFNYLAYLAFGCFIYKCGMKYLKNNLN